MAVNVLDTTAAVCVPETEKIVAVCDGPASRSVAVALFTVMLQLLVLKTADRSVTTVIVDVSGDKKERDCVAPVPMNVIACVDPTMTPVAVAIWKLTRYHCVPSLATLTMRVAFVFLGAGRLTILLRTLAVFGVAVTPKNVTDFDVSTGHSPVAVQTRKTFSSAG